MSSEKDPSIPGTPGSVSEHPRNHLVVERDS